MRRFETIEEMEAAAREEEDGAVAVKIRSEWLEVWTLRDGGHVYKWGRNCVPRAVAARVLATAPEPRRHDQPLSKRRPGKLRRQERRFVRAAKRPRYADHD